MSPDVCAPTGAGKTNVAILTIMHELGLHRLEDGSFDVVKFRGDEEREFVSENFEVKSFPTIVVLKDGKMTKYDSEERTVEAMKKFAESA